MSDSWICIVPEAPQYVPTEKQIADATVYFHEIAPDAEEIVPEVLEHVSFHDCGSNFERAMCPACGEEIDLEKWEAWMDQDVGGEGFRLSKFEMPCCGQEASLDQLQYEFEQGFGRFELAAANPNLGELPEEVRKEFERRLGCRVRVIYRHL